MSCSKLFECAFGPTITIVSVDVSRGNVEIKIVTNKSTLLNKTYPNNSPARSEKVPRIQLPYSIVENTVGDITTFKYMFGNKDICEMGINHKSKRVSYVGSFVDIGSDFQILSVKDDCSCHHGHGRDELPDWGDHKDHDHGRNSPDIPNRPPKPPKPPQPPSRPGRLGKAIKLSKLIEHFKPDDEPNEDVYVFPYTGTDQSFLIPTNAISVVVQCWGAGGATQGYGRYTMYNTGFGGGGGYTKSELKSVAGQTINIVVGQGGQSKNDGINVPATYGGGGSQILNGDSNWGSASGGGRSAIQMMINGDYSDIVVAGGGGGGGGNTASGAKGYEGIGSGGAGGGTKGQDAEVYSDFPIYGGTGGTDIAGGSNGIATTGHSGLVIANLEIAGGDARHGAGGGSGYYGGGCGGISDYNGQIDSVPEESDEITTDSLVSWYDGMKNENLTLDGGGVVKAWKDLSNTGSDAIPFTGTCTYSGTALGGKYPGISMNDSSLMAPLATGTFDDGFTLFVVFSNVGNQQFNTLVNRSEILHGNYPGPWDFYQNTRLIGNNSIASVNAVTNFNTSMTPSIFIAQASATASYSEFLNGGNFFQTDSLKSNYKDTGDELYIGTRRDQVTSFNGVMSEIMIYNKVLNQSELDSVQSYLATKWGITVTPINASTAGAEPSGDHWIFGGGAGGSSYVNPDYGSTLRLDQADKNIVAGEDEIPAELAGTIGNGAANTNATKGGSNGQNGYVILTVKT